MSCLLSTGGEVAIYHGTWSADSGAPLETPRSVERSISSIITTDNLGLENQEGLRVPCKLDRPVGMPSRKLSNAILSPRGLAGPR